MNELEEYKLIFEHFKQMENRYHTWMNYYSLFNGALLVAYCTILVSTGEIAEKNSYVMPMEDSTTKDRILFSLECTYWEFLVLIASLGGFVSYCWLRSMQGHCAWLDSWRKALQSMGQEFDRTIYVDSKKYSDKSDEEVFENLELYSTARITTVFIKGVMVAWGMVGLYAIASAIDSNWKEKCLYLIGGIVILIVLLLTGFHHANKKSDIDGFALKKVYFPNKAPDSSIHGQVSKALDKK